MAPNLDDRHAPAAALPPTAADEPLHISNVELRGRAVGVEQTGDGERYDLRGDLGEGGMGEVRLYEDTRIGRQVALKRIHPAHQHRANVHARFLREARIQGQLEHPAIVPVYDLGRMADGMSYFTMKRVLGRTLEDVLSGLRDGDAETTRTYSRRKLLTAFGTVSLAVHFAHTRGVVHRDLKPANIMLGEFGEVYVLDWGVAKLRENYGHDATPAAALPSEARTTADEMVLGPTLPGAADDAPPADSRAGDAPGESEPTGRGTDPVATVAGAVLGTPGYIAPEQLRGETVDGRADVYALGSILFEILTLERLHSASNAAEIYASTLEGTDSRPSLRPRAQDVPPELDAVCTRATALDPAERFPTARALQESIERYLDGDRDLELRRELADSHADRATEALGSGGSVEDASLQGRSTALGEVGRALALDPTNEPARHTLLQLLTQPPREIPPDALADLAARRREEQRVVGITGGFSYATFLLYLPIVFAMGVRDWSAFSWSMSLFVVTILVCFAFARRPPADRRIALVPLAIASAAIGSMATMFGPLILMPQIALMNTVGFILATRRAHRIVTVTIGALGIVIPLAMQLSGVLPSSYAFRDGALVIVPRMHGFPPGATMTFLVLSILGHLVFSCAFAMRFRDALTKAHLKQHLQEWQLRQLAPAPTRG